MNDSQKWPKESRYIALVGVVICLVGIIWYFRGIINPLVVAAIFAYVLHPVVNFLADRTRLSHSLAVIIVYLGSLLLLAGLFAWLTPILVNQIRAIELDLESMLLYYDEFASSPVEILQWTFFPGEILPGLPVISTDLLTPITNNIFSIIQTITKNFIWVLIVFVGVFYFLQDGTNVKQWIVRLAPNQYRDDADHIFEQLSHVWADYLRSQIVFMFVVGLVDSIAWLIVGLPGAIILGFLTGLTSFVHEIGAIVSGILSVLAALIGGSSVFRMSNFWFAVLVFILYMILTGIKNIWLRPVIVGRHVHLHAGIVFVVVIAALIFHGALAAFLVVPVLVSLLVIGRYLRRRILGLQPFQEGQDPSSYFSLTIQEE